MKQHSDYVSQLKLEFDSCAVLSPVSHNEPVFVRQVNFEEFKEGFVAVLSRSLDFSTSEDDSSYLQPVVPEEVKPKLVKGSKRYGRRSRPDSSSSSVESLKSDEETGSQKENEVDELLDVRDFQKVLRGSAPFSCSSPFSCSTPLRSADLQRVPYRVRLTHQTNTQNDQNRPGSLISGCGLLSWVKTDRRTALTRTTCYSQGAAALEERSVRSGSAALEECSVRSTSPSLLTAAGGGQRVLTRLDEGSGCTGPERVLNLWREEGIRNSRDILQVHAGLLPGGALSLVDLTLALDNELLVSGNGIHQAALISYKNEIQHLQVQVEQACRQRDKMKADLEQAEQRNLQLVGEVDERHACMETLNHSRIRELQQDFRERVQCVRSEAEQENEALLEKGERERASLQEELRLLREKELQLEEELSSTSQRDLDQLLHLKFGSLDPAAAGLSHEERFSQIVKDYELQLRELRDRNDELSSEVELLKNQRSEKKSRRSAGDAPNWTQQHNSDESDMKRGASPPARKNIQTELAVEQMKMKHNEDLQQLHIQLETQVNYYERSLEVMRQSMEVERKDISQAFKDAAGACGSGAELRPGDREPREEEEEAQRNEEQRAFWENRLDQSEQEKKRLEEQLDQSEQDKKSLKEQLDQSEQEKKSLEEQLDQSEQEKKRLEEQLDLSEQEKKSLEEQLDQSEQEKKSLEEQLDLSEQEKKRLEEQLDQSEQEKKRLEEQLDLSEQEKKSLEEQLDQSEQEKKSLEEQLDLSEQEKKRLEEQLDQSEQEKKRLEEQLAILMEAVHDSHLLLSQSEASTQEVRRRCKDLEEHLKASRRRCEENQRRCEELEEDLKASSRRCEELEENQRRCEELEENQRRCEELEENQRRCEELEENQRRCEELEENQRRCEELEENQRRCEELEEDLKASRRRCEELEENQRRCEELEENQRRCEELEENLKASRRRCEELEERLKEACRQLEESICASSLLTEEKESLRRDRARLIQDLKEQAMAVDHLQEAYVVLGQFLLLKKDSEMFSEWLKDASGANSRQAGSCSQCLREWCDAFL
ncbi:Ninein-like protein [Dissostichus eleginoides]|uniref:Ninein-like protein n=1 Tax=Dissostichus eleginoides TaxID=100907 RepID=A0AAD9CPQ4_DISEL|nr:Ninein-like protein [Dissostichus eleginoides]